MKTIKMFVTALMTVLLISAKASGQDVGQPFDAHTTVWGGMFAPQGPEALAITRHGDPAPNLYHGAASLSIPVYEWKDNLFDIPISLEYSTTGFRPGAACGPVGLDWTLLAGGVITREIRGIPDEAQATYFNATMVLYNNPTEREDPPSEYIFTEQYRVLPDPYTGLALRGYASWYESNASYADTTNIRCIYTGQLAGEFLSGYPLSSNPNVLVEGEPDIFHFNCPGHSGSFILQPGHGVRFLGCDGPSGELNVVFYPTPGAGSYFVLTDGLGVQYTFADIEETYAFDALNGSDESEYAVSSWRLSSIKHPSGNTVTFTYSTRTQTNVSPVISADHMTIRDNSGIQTRPYIEQWKSENYSDEALIYNVVYSKYLTGIDFANRGTATFNWSDIGRLSSIEIYNGDSDLLKSCLLGYYIPKTGAGASHPTLAFLTSVSLSGEGVYSMTYDSADNNHSFPVSSFSSDNDL